MKKTVLALTLTIMTLSTTAAYAQDSLYPYSSAGNSPEKFSYEYECTPQELSDFIKKETAVIRSTSPVPTADEVQAATIAARLKEQKNSGGNGNCLAVWGDVLNNIDFAAMYQKAKAAYDAFSATSMMAAILTVARDMAQEMINELVDKIYSQLCDLVDPSFIEEMILEKVNVDYGFDAERFLRDPNKFTNDYIDDALRKKYGSNSKYIRDPMRIGEDLGDAVEDSIKDKIDDFWGN